VTHIERELERALASDPAHQVARSRLMMDWWSGRIVPWVRNREKAEIAERQLTHWSEQLLQ